MGNEGRHIYCGRAGLQGAIKSVCGLPGEVSQGAKEERAKSSQEALIGIVGRGRAKPAVTNDLRRNSLHELKVAQRPAEQGKVVVGVDVENPGCQNWPRG